MREFFPEAKEYIDELVQEARDNFQMPFDELFHRQKTAIQNVIDAEKALEEKVASLKDPAEHTRIDFDKMDAEQRAEVQEILS